MLASQKYGAQLERVFTRDECRRKARMIVAMLAELLYGQGEDVDVCRSIANGSGLMQQIPPIANMVAQIAGLDDKAWAQCKKKPTSGRKSKK